MEQDISRAPASKMQGWDRHMIIVTDIPIPKGRKWNRYRKEFPVLMILRIWPGRIPFPRGSDGKCHSSGLPPTWGPDDKCLSLRPLHTLIMARPPQCLLHMVTPVAQSISTTPPGHCTSQYSHPYPRPSPWKPFCTEWSFLFLFFKFGHTAQHERLPWWLRQ